MTLCSPNETMARRWLAMFKPSNEVEGIIARAKVERGTEPWA